MYLCICTFLSVCLFGALSPARLLNAPGRDLCSSLEAQPQLGSAPQAVQPLQRIPQTWLMLATVALSPPPASSRVGGRGETCRPHDSAQKVQTLALSG